MNMLALGSSVLLRDRQESARVEARVGMGGQGEVYRVRVGARAFALKWYFPTMANPRQYHAIERLLERGAPGKGFLWPIDIASSPAIPSGFGYIMELREEGFREIQDLLFPKGHRRHAGVSIRDLLFIASDLADSLRRLHAMGFCFRDVSDKNIFFNAEQRRALFCDCDNVGVQADASEASQVLGTMPFMAPELVRGDALHDTTTDLASLAILLFHVFLRGHPFEGVLERAVRCKDADAMRRLYGGAVPYIFDSGDPSNRPVPGVHAPAGLKDYYPPLLMQAFERVFVEGWRNSSLRLREGEWRRCLDAVLDMIDECPRCGTVRFFRGPSGLERCENPNCGQPRPTPLFLCLGSRTVFLRSGNQIYAHHLLGGGSTPDYSRRIAQVVTHPSDSTRVGIRNDSGQPWVVNRGSQSRPVRPDEVMAISRECRIVFPGGRSGVVTDRP